jgi:hypothetical protein
MLRNASFRFIFTRFEKLAFPSKKGKRMKRSWMDMSIKEFSQLANEWEPLVAVVSSKCIGTSVEEITFPIR